MENGFADELGSAPGPGEDDSRGGVAEVQV
jgi:hypothetical protein